MPARTKAFSHWGQPPQKGHPDFHRDVLTFQAVSKAKN